MRTRVMSFATALRDAGMRLSVGEVDDALRAVGAVGVERERLREGLATTLVKDEADRALFDGLFDAHFPLAQAEGARARRRPKRRGMPAGMGGRGRGEEEGTRGARPRPRDAPGRSGAAREGEAERPQHARARPRLDRGRALELRRRVVEDLDADDLREARAIAALLGRAIERRVRRRTLAARRGRVDLRRTARAALATGGVPLAIRRRGRRPDRPDLLALCDVSGSVAAASDLLLALLAAMPAAFRRADLFVYVDRPVGVSVEAGHMAPAEPFDLHARSDFGRVLGGLEAMRVPVTRRTVVLILGDARNNRLPARADRLRALAERAGRVVWLVPEPTARWNTGDSALAAYAAWCDVVLECRTLEALGAAVRRQVA